MLITFLIILLLIKVFSSLWKVVRPYISIETLHIELVLAQLAPLLLLLVDTSCLLTRQLGMSSCRLFILLLSNALAVSKFFRLIQLFPKAFVLAFNQLLHTLLLQFY
jgi:hypothetical protein